MKQTSPFLSSTSVSNVIGLASLVIGIVFGVLALPSALDANVYCPPLLSNTTIQKWEQAGDVSETSIGRYIDEFDLIRGVDGGFRTGDTLSKGVYIITAFDDRGNTLAYQAYDVKPVVHFKSIGVFRTTKAIKTDFPGACLALDHSSPNFLLIVSVFFMVIFVIMVAFRLQLHKKFFSLRK